MNNHLKHENSPYLLQHANNPVEWYSWCDEAFKKAEKEDKPIFLSIGYSTCHWCHVMAHESFENKKIAEILNNYFISIKVDREERPDIDSVYMSVCQAFTGSGGWPMSIFMTANQKPFFAGTYFPPVSRQGIMGFEDLLLTVAKRWEDNREALFSTAEQVSSILNHTVKNSDDSDIDMELPKRALKQFMDSFDTEYGGFGSAPKFPTPHNLLFLMLYGEILKKHDNHKIYKDAFAMADKTLEAMRRGGIFDHIGYGFSRYSTDRYFLAPHFEKMLYDNALLIIAYAVYYHISDKHLYLDTAMKTANFVLNEMTGKEGEFFSALDADSDGEEGKFYIWNYKEICDILGEEKGKAFCNYYNITKSGNFNGQNIPNLLNGNDITDYFDKERQVLYLHRQKREKLHLDDKVLTSWNSLMICAMTILYRISGKKKYLLAAENAADFILKNLTDGNILYVSLREKKRSVKGFLDEYVNYLAALIFLYSVTSNTKYLDRAEEICAEIQHQFADNSGMGYFLYGNENSSLIARPKESYDGALPSGNSVMAYCLVRLYHITGKEKYKELSERQLKFMSDEAKEYPAGHSLFLISLLLYKKANKKITIVLSQKDKLEEILCQIPLYYDTMILNEETSEYKLLNGKTTYYICKNHVCLPPSNYLSL